jgi:hypothetical protein
MEAFAAFFQTPPKKYPKKYPNLLYNTEYNTVDVY